MILVAKFNKENIINVKACH